MHTRIRTHIYLSIYLSTYTCRQTDGQTDKQEDGKTDIHMYILHRMPCLDPRFEKAGFNNNCLATAPRPRSYCPPRNLQASWHMIVVTRLRPISMESLHTGLPIKTYTSQLCGPVSLKVETASVVQVFYMGVSQKRGPPYIPQMLDSLYYKSPQIGTSNFWKQPYECV